MAFPWCGHILVAWSLGLWLQRAWTFAQQPEAQPFNYHTKAMAKKTEAVQWMRTDLDRMEIKIHLMQSGVFLLLHPAPPQNRAALLFFLIPTLINTAPVKPNPDQSLVWVCSPAFPKISSTTPGVFPKARISALSLLPPTLRAFCQIDKGFTWCWQGLLWTHLCAWVLGAPVTEGLCQGHDWGKGILIIFTQVLPSTQLDPLYQKHFFPTSNELMHLDY